MRIVFRGLLIATVFGSVVVLVLSIWPGVLLDLLFIGILASMMLGVLAGFGVLLAIVIGRLYIAFVGVNKDVIRRFWQPRLIDVPVSQVFAISFVWVLTYVLLEFQVPRRGAFALSRSSFEQRLTTAPRTSNPQADNLNVRLGVYHVDTYAADPRGGVYFRVYSSVIPFSNSYGFVYQPNQEESPFGTDSYYFFHITDDWYWFSARHSYHHHR